MEKNHYLGGMVRQSAFWRNSRFRDLDGQTTWQCPLDADQLFCRVSGSSWTFLPEPKLAVLLRGYALLPGQAKPDNSAVARIVGRHYLDRGELPVNRLEGSYTLVLLDGRAGRVVLCSNLVGTGTTYYTERAGGFLFSSNLADLVDAPDSTPDVNRAALPAFFLYRHVPGRETLFKGCYRVQPGEQVTFDSAGLVCQQRLTMGSMLNGTISGKDVPEQVEECLGRVIRDCAVLDPNTANLLSGGVDSALLQVLWNQARPARREPPASYSVSVDHPYTRGDTQYALSAARMLRCRHTLVPAEAPFWNYLRDTISGTGLPPNHVQTCYFGRLGRALGAQGVRTSLCGEGADSLFGMTSTETMRTVRTLRSLLPGSMLSCGAALAGLLGRRYLGGCFRMANLLEDTAHHEHPLNQVDFFTDLPTTLKCFRKSAVQDAMTSRQGVLDLHEIPGNLLDRTHALAFLSAAALETAAPWATLFNRAGGDIFFPFLDSRVIRLAVNLDHRKRFPFRRPKDLLKRVLVRHGVGELAKRPKLSFGQPIFEWLRPGGQLRKHVERLRAHDFVKPAVLDSALAQPSWFLYSLLSFDTWHRMFIERSLPRIAEATPRAPAAALQSA